MRHWSAVQESGELLVGNVAAGHRVGKVAAEIARRGNGAAAFQRGVVRYLFTARQRRPPGSQNNELGKQHAQQAADSYLAFPGVVVVGEQAIEGPFQLGIAIRSPTQVAQNPQVLTGEQVLVRGHVAVYFGVKAIECFDQ